MTERKKKDTSVSLHPLSFEEAIEALAKTPKREGSEAEGSYSTSEDDPESGPTKKRNAPRQ